MKDPEIRHNFKKKFLSNLGTEVLVLEELGIMRGESIIDIALLGHELLEGFEIKSGSDSVTRLPKQVGAYNQVFDSITIILEQTHLGKALNLIPSFWGVIIVEKTWDGLEYKYYRKPERNPLVDPKKKVQLLWRDELVDILRSLKVRGYSKLRRKKLWDLLIKNYPQEKLNQLIFDTLKKRVNWKIPGLFDSL